MTSQQRTPGDTMTSTEATFEEIDNEGLCATCAGHIYGGEGHTLRECVRRLHAQIVGLRMGLDATQNRLQAAVNHYD